MVVRLLTYPEQVAAHLRSEIFKGRWVGEIPGADRLGVELNVNHTTIGAAIQILENEGLLRNRGAGRKRHIVLPDNIAPPLLRMGLFLYENIEDKVDYIVDLKNKLLGAGHSITVPSKGLRDLNMDLSRITQLVSKTKADAWVVQAGSAEVLEWFAAQPTPAFALGGRRRSVQIAGTGPDKVPAIGAAVRRLVKLGHSRVVMIAREERRKPHPGLVEKSFLNELKALGVAVGSYNLPDWDESVDGFYDCLNSLFRHTPPTAIIVDDLPLYLAVERHLSRLGYHAPNGVSLVCLDPSPAFKWFRPAVTHVSWDSGPMVNRILKWATNVAHGKIDCRQSFTKADFVEAGTIGPVPK
jgi:hypothetical protein